MTLPVQKFDFYTCSQVSDQYRIYTGKEVNLVQWKKKEKRKKKFLPTYLP